MPITHAASVSVSAYLEKLCSKSGFKLTIRSSQPVTEKGIETALARAHDTVISSGIYGKGNVNMQIISAMANAHPEWDIVVNTDYDASLSQFGNHRAAADVQPRK